jgi:hypothetical protein
MDRPASWGSSSNLFAFPAPCPELRAFEDNAGPPVCILSVVVEAAGKGNTCCPVAVGRLDSLERMIDLPIGRARLDVGVLVPGELANGVRWRSPCSWLTSAT